MYIEDTGVVIVEDDANNTDVSYNQPDNLAIMNPIPNTGKSQARYVPIIKSTLVSTLVEKCLTIKLDSYQFAMTNNRNNDTPV